MAENYDWGINPLKDFIFQLLMYDSDISKEKYKIEIKNTILYLLEEIGVEEKDLNYLDYDIKRHYNKYKIIPENIVCALWFSGLFPTDCYKTNKENKLIFKNKKYIFNEKTKRLTWKKIKE